MAGIAESNHSAITSGPARASDSHLISLAKEILALTFDKTLASIVKLHATESREVVVDDPAILEDIDTPEDYNRALERWKEKHQGPSIKAQTNSNDPNCKS